MFAGDFAPSGWAICDNQFLAIVEHTALFAVIGNKYGGDGVSTFCVPDLRSSVPMGRGKAPGLPQRDAGPSPVPFGLPDGHDAGIACVNFIIALSGDFPKK